MKDRNVPTHERLKAEKRGDVKARVIRILFHPFSIILLLLFILTILLIYGSEIVDMGRDTSAQPSEIEKYIGQGFNLLEHQKYARAIRKFRAVIKSYSLHLMEARNRDSGAMLRAYEGLAQAYADKRDISSAIEALEDASNIWPSEGKIQFYLGVLYSRLDRLQSRSSIDGSSLSHHSFTPPPLASLRGLLQARPSTQITRAVEHYRRSRSLGFNGSPEAYKTALKLDPNNANLYYSLGLEYQDRKKYFNAIEEFEKALALAPKHPIYLCCIGITYLRLDRYKDAESYLRRALKVLPKFPDALGGLGEVYLRQKRYKEAKVSLCRAITFNPKDAYAHYLLGNVYAAQGQDAKAIAEYRKAIRLGPDDYTYHYKLAQALTRQDKKEEAEKELGRYKKLYTKYLEASTENAMRSAKAASVALQSTNSPSYQSSAIEHQPLTLPQISANGFVDATVEAGINFRHRNGAKDTPTILEATGSGAAFCDYDNDGFLDAYIVTGCYLNLPKDCQQPYNALYRNIGNGKFTDVTIQAGVGDTGYGMGCVFADYDNDGDDDLYITNYGRNVLYRNNGDGTFTDVTKIAGIGDARFGTSCAFGDYDSDGDLDLYVVNYVEFGPESIQFCLFEGVKAGCGPLVYDGQSDVLYRNNGDGTFTDVTAEAGALGPSSQGLGVIFWDYDNDNRPDIYVANDAVQNFLFHNRGSSSSSLNEPTPYKTTFEEISLLAGVGFDENGTADSGMGVDAGDYDNDGDLDLLVANFQDRSNTLYRNDGNGIFTDVTRTCGLAEPTVPYLTFGSQFFDYNNDGFLDIFAANGHIHDNVEMYRNDATSKQRNQLFRNNQDGTFTEVSDIAGAGLQIMKISRGAAFGDYDNDGDIDILVTNSNDTVTLLRNSDGNRNNFLSVKLIGTKSNRDAIGARIKVTAGHLTQIREVKCGSSYLSHNDYRQLFGLAQRKLVDSVEIRWPSGDSLKLENVEVNKMIVVKESEKVNEILTQ